VPDSDDFILTTPHQSRRADVFKTTTRSILSPIFRRAEEQPRLPPGRDGTVNAVTELDQHPTARESGANRLFMDIRIESDAATA